MSWQLVRLADIATLVQYGYTASASESEIGPKFLRITDIVPQWIDWAKVPYCKINEKDIVKYLLAPGDIVVARTGASVGYAKQIRDNKPAVFASYLVRVRVDSDKAEPEYIGRVVESNTYKKFVLSRVEGVAQPNANAKVLTSFLVPIPEISVQKRIASTLSAYDDLIENNRRRISLLEKSAQLLYKEWFVHLRFPGYQHTTITDGVPAGWSTCGIMEHPYFELISENIGQFDGFKRYYATADVSGTSITGKGIEYDYHKKPSRAQKKPEIGSVWFARMQDTYKILVFTETNRDLVENSMLSSGFVGFRARQTNFIPFLYMSIHNKRFHEEKDRFCSGATQRSLTNGGLKRIRVQVPTTSMVSAFADLASPIIDQILTLQAVNQKLNATRDLLLPRLMHPGITV